MGKKSINLIHVFLFLYLFFLSFFNYTPFYLASALILIVLTVLKIIKKRKVIITPYIYFELFFIFYNFMWVLLGLSINNISSLTAIKTLCLNIAINFAITNSIDNIEELKKVINWIIPIALFACAFIILYTKGAGIDGRLAHGVKRLFSDTTYKSMEVANWAIYASLLLLESFFNDKKIIKLIPLIFFFIIVVWSGSRKCLALYMLLFVMVYLSHIDKEKIIEVIRKFFKIIVIIIIFIICIFKVPILYNKVGHRIVGYFDNSESSAASRNTMRIVVKDYIKKRPLLGYGLDTFRNVSKYNTWSECNWLELTFSGGIFLTIIYYTYDIILIIKLLKLKNRDNIYKVLLYIVICQVVFDYTCMSYIGRFETFMITISSLAVYLEKSCNKNKTNKNIKESDKNEIVYSNCLR